MRSVLVISLFFLCSSVFAQNSPRRIVSGPAVLAPAEAVATGLGGRVRVEVKVNKAGEVTSVGSVFGPDWVCPSIKRPDVTALRETARTFAKEVRFAPGDGGSTEWIGFTFPARKTDVKTKDSAANSNIPKQIDGGVINGKALRLPKPPYPPEAHANRASGVVKVQVVIDEDGTVFSAEPISGHPLLLGAVRTSACGAQFSQTKLAGQAVKVSGVISYNFIP